ncbi:MAG: gluconokinase [Bacillota bacterium]
MEGPYFIGLDIGTAGCRAVLFDLNGQPVSVAAQEYPLLQPRPGWAEQEPERVYEAVCRALKQCVARSRVNSGSIAGMGLDSVFHSVVAVGAGGEPLSNALIWADNRSVRQADFLKGADNGMQIYGRTGCRVHPMYPFAKILWFKEERPEIFRRAAKFVSLKEYVIHRWFGRFVIDKSVASGTGLFNIHTLQWDDECLDLAGIRREQLSETVPVTEVVGRLTKETAVQLGVPEGLPVVVGAADGVLSSLGSGASSPGQVVAMVGTSGAVRVISERPLTDPRGRTWCYVMTDRHWVVGGAINNGGIVYRWFRDTLGEKEVREAEEKGVEAYELLNRLAEKAGPGAEGLLCLPFLTGERSPNWNPDARGVFFGLGLHHGKAHLVRALMEGVIYRLYSVFQAITELVGEPAEIRAAGGFTRSPLWCQIMSDVFGYPVKLPAVHEAPSLGAALLAMWGLGFVDGIGAIDKMVKVRREFLPDRRNREIYRELYNLYRQVYRSLQPHFALISNFQRRDARH